MKNIIKISLIILTFSVLFADSNQIINKITLSDAIRIGLKNNYQIKISKENLSIAENNNSWGTAGRYPSVNISLSSVNSINNDPSTTNPLQRSKFNTYILNPGISLNWVIFKGFSVKITKDKLEMLNKISAENKEIIVESTIQAIILAYNKVILEKDKLKITKKLRNLSKDRYDYVLNRQKYGLSITTDVLNAKIAYLTDESNVIAQEMNLKNARRNLNLVMGNESDKKFEISEKFEHAKASFKFKNLVKKLYNNNRNIRNQYINLEILRKNIKLGKSSYYPTVSLNSGISMNKIGIKYENIPLNSSNSYDYFVNFSINMNLFNGGNTKRAIANAKINEKIGNLKMAELKFSLVNRLKGLIDLYKLREDLLKISSKNIEAAELNLNLSNEKFKTGAISSFNYRDIQIIYLNTALGRLQSQYNLIDTEIEIKRLLGELTKEYIR